MVPPGRISVLRIAWTVSESLLDAQGTGRAAAGVILLSAGDGLADTVRPRLDAAEADVQWIRALTCAGHCMGNPAEAVAQLGQVA